MRRMRSRKPACGHRASGRRVRNVAAVRTSPRVRQDLAGLSKGRMDVELRTVAAEPRLRETLRAGPAEPVSGMIDLHQEERYGRSAGTLRASSAGSPPARRTPGSGRSGHRCRIAPAARPQEMPHRASSSRARHSGQVRNGRCAGLRPSKMPSDRSPRRSLPDKAIWATSMAISRN